MEKIPRTFSWDVKERAVKRMLSGERPTALSRELGVARPKLYKWRDQYKRGGPGLWRRAEGRPEDGVSSRSSARPLEERTDQASKLQRAELERKVGRQQLVIDFLQEALRRVEGGHEQTNSSGATGSSPISER